MKIVIVDFDDSFTYNIASSFKDIGYQDELEIVHWTRFSYQKKQERTLYLFGPGPGRPQDYGQVRPELQKILKSGDKVIGICLGHQMIGEEMGLSLSPCVEPIHGQKRKYSLNKYWQSLLGLKKREMTVQHYNSWTLKVDENNSLTAFSSKQEILMLAGKNIFSCQFHPESIGTEERLQFFSFMRRFA